MQQRIKDLENDRDRLWAEARALRKRISKTYAAAEGITPARCADLSAVMHQHRDGGGALIYDFGAQRPVIESYIGSQQLTALSVTFENWEATDRGGPYVELDGTNDALYIADASWQEVSDGTLGTDETLFVWHWVNTDDETTTQAFSSKWDFNGDNRSWTIKGNGGAFWKIAVSGVGTSGGAITQASSTQLATGWHFVAGYWQASTLLRIFVAAASDTSLQIDSNTTSIPASLYDGSAPLAIGTRFNSSPTLDIPWDGKVGRGQLRFGVPATDINDYVDRLFQSTKFFYGG